jgi:hypothetical protein
VAELTDRDIRERLGRIPRRVEEINKESAEVSRIVEDSLRSNIQMSQSEIAQHAVRYASIHYKEFYEFLKTAHKEDPRQLEYVSPGAITLAGERQLACLVIGIGVAWLWVVVSPWTTGSSTIQ